MLATTLVLDEALLGSLFSDRFLFGLLFWRSLGFLGLTFEAGLQRFHDINNLSFGLFFRRNHNLLTIYFTIDYFHYVITNLVCVFLWLKLLRGYLFYPLNRKRQLCLFDICLDVHLAPNNVCRVLCTQIIL